MIDPPVKIAFLGVILTIAVELVDVVAGVKVIEQEVRVSVVSPLN
jgi:hypothetical protein